VTSESATSNLISTEIQIECDIERAWVILTDFAGYRTWNPYIVRIDGEPQAGSAISVHLSQGNGRQLIVQPIELISVSPFTMRWQGGLPDRSKFAGDHWFELSSPYPGETLLRHFEYFTGSRLAEFLKTHAQVVEDNFNRFNRALKSRCEAR
jgi:hypothetical protein